MKVKFYLKEPKKKQSLIVARIMWGSHQLPYSTKQIVETKYWIKNNKQGVRVQRVMQTNAYPNNVEINQALDDLRTYIGKVFVRYTNENHQQEPSKSEFKELLDIFLQRGKAKVGMQVVPTFMSYLNNFIEKSKKGIRVNRKNGKALSTDTIKTYTTLLGHLNEYNKGLDWQDINLAFHNDYTEWLMETYDLQNSSIGKDVSIIKVVCREAYYEKINKFDDFENPLFNVMRETSDTIYLDKSEIEILYNLDLSNNKVLEVTRDLFVLGCITGLRYSDYSKLQKSQIDGYKLHVKTVKGSKQLEVNIRAPMAQALINKYSKQLPQAAVNQVFNRHLKEICKDIPEFRVITEKTFTKGGKMQIEKLPKYERIKSHSARRSFCTNEVKANTPIPIIMASSGHTSEKSFWKYVKLSAMHYQSMYDKIVIDRHAALKAV